MEQSQALHKLLESADLIKMVEDLTNAGAYDKLSASGLAGIRITLRSIRENILASHDLLAGNLVQQSRLSMEPRQPAAQPEQQIAAKPAVMTTPPLSTMLGAQVQTPQSNISIENGSKAEPAAIRSEATTIPSRMALLSDPEKLQMMRKDLRASLEKMVDR
ncbi:MAG: hypothetical protein J5J00_03665 [Deltaproteobacteria bacterium]|nr:hypothetical protein [Deltaproteobacteria bacterium]